jgi:uncharacterized membrane protein
MSRRHPPKTRPDPITSPTVPPPQPAGLAPVLHRNIAALQEWRAQQLKNATMQERLAEAITRFTGSMAFVYLHLALFGFWILANLNWIPGIPSWDPSFVMLAMVASVEAIFLSTFVLINQNQMTAAAEQRAELDLQISLLAEHEITKLVEVVSDIAEKMGIAASSDPELQEAKENVAPEAVLQTLEANSMTSEEERPGTRAAGVH